MSFRERLILRILAEEGSVTLGKLFWILLKREPLFFIGDAGVARVVQEIERAVEPPVLRTIETPGERLFRNKLALTQAGRDVLSGKRDWHSLKPPSRWVGGVHVEPACQAGDGMRRSKNRFGMSAVSADVDPKRLPRNRPTPFSCVPRHLA